MQSQNKTNGMSLRQEEEKVQVSHDIWVKNCHCRRHRLWRWWWLVVLVVVARLKKWKASDGKCACLLRCPKKWVAWVSHIQPKKVIDRGRCRPSQFQSSLSQRHHHLQNSDFPPTLLALSFQNFIHISLQLQTISHSKQQLTLFTQIAAREYQERRK